jgi:hypothetical protein
MHTLQLEHVKRKNNLGEIGFPEKMTLKIILEKCEGVDWIYITQGRVQRWSAMNTVLNLEVS